MTRATLATCTRALYARLEALDNDIRTNGDYYRRSDWRGQIHRKRAAAEILSIRRAIKELRLIEWGVAA